MRSSSFLCFTPRSHAGAAANSSYSESQRFRPSKLVSDGSSVFLERKRTVDGASLDRSD